MKILVTGAGGFLGGRIVERLLNRGHTVRALVRRPRGAAWESRVENPVEIMTGNLLDGKLARHAVQGVDAIIHAAAAMRGAPADMFLNTVVASKNLLEGLDGARPPRILLVSTFGVYGTAALARGAVIDERTPLEPSPERRDAYSHAKLRQERLFDEYREKFGFDLTILRPGVLYGPGGGGISTRIGVSMFGIFLSLGRGNLLPLSYVENCADAVVLAAEKPESAGHVYNVHDDDLPTCSAFLKGYKRHVRHLRSVPVPYAALMMISRIVQAYHEYSKGQLPAAFSPYETRTLWIGRKFDNRKLKGLGWNPAVSTADGMRRAFDYLRSREP